MQAVVVDTPWWVEFLNSIAPAVTLAITGLIATLATILAVRLNSWFGITNELQARTNEALIRDVLHNAVWSAVKMAATKTGLTLPELGRVVSGDISLNKAFIETAIEYVRSKNPDTAAAAGLTPDAKGDKGLTDIITSKLPDLIKMLTDALPVSPINDTNIPYKPR